MPNDMSITAVRTMNKSNFDQEFDKYAPSPRKKPFETIFTKHSKKNTALNAKSK